MSRRARRARRDEEAAGDAEPLLIGEDGRSAARARNAAFGARCPGRTRAALEADSVEEAGAVVAGGAGVDVERNPRISGRCEREAEPRSRIPGEEGSSTAERCSFIAFERMACAFAWAAGTLAPHYCAINAKKNGILRFFRSERTRAQYW